VGVEHLANLLYRHCEWIYTLSFEAFDNLAFCRIDYRPIAFG
jgi:hypothetical protein